MADSPERVVELPGTSEPVASEAGPPAHAEPPQRTPKTGQDWIEIIPPLLIPVGVVGFIVFSNETSRDFVFRWWWSFAIGGLVIIVGTIIVLAFPAGRRWLKNAGATVRAAIFSFGVLPLLLGVVVSVAFLPQAYQPTALRAAFFLVVCLLPAMMWFLFLATRKASLLNEFVANLDRLGLLQPAAGETQDSKSRRVKSYLQKFEAIYGDLPDTIHNDVLGNRFSPKLAVDTRSFIALSTTTVPVMLSTVLIALGWLIALSLGESVSSSDATSWVAALEPKVAPVTLAFLGAYFFSLQMLFRRYVLDDLGGTAYVNVSMRIVLAVIAIWVFVPIGQNLIGLNDTYLLAFGFVFGVFPRIIWQILESTFKRAAGFVLPSMTSQLLLSDLDGLNVWHEARLEEEDIENIPNMATADLVELLLNTRLPPERIIDWVDQAILYTQLGPQRKRDQSARHNLRIHGIRTATSLLRAAAEAQKQGSREAFDRILSDGIAMQTLEASLATSSNLRLVQRWNRIPDRSLEPGDVLDGGESRQRTAA
jgi:MFS family permease